MTMFKFKLEKILEYRRQLEDQAKLALATAQQRYRLCVEKLEKLKATLARSEEEFGGRRELRAEEVWLFRHFKERLLLDMRRVEVEMQAAAKAVQAARQQLVQRAKDRKLLEKLKENQAKRHAKELQAKEQKEYDEGSAMRFKHTDI